MPEKILSLKSVSVFQEGNVILSNLNLEVNKGDFLYIIGRTGSGKSSFMKTLYGDLSLKEGNGNIVGYDLVKLKEDEIPFLRRKIGFVFQDFKLLTDRSVKANLLFVLKATGWTNKSAMEDKIDDVLKKVGMQEFLYKMPHQLSGGEQQRIAIARALLNNPEIILADEPTGNLDPHTSAEILVVLKKINSTGKTVIISTHDYSLLTKFPAKTIKFENGKMIEEIKEFKTTSTIFVTPNT